MHGQQNIKTVRVVLRLLLQIDETRKCGLRGEILSCATLNYEAQTHTHHYSKHSRNVYRPAYYSFFRSEQFLNVMQYFTTLSSRVNTIAHRSV